MAVIYLFFTIKSTYIENVTICCTFIFTSNEMLELSNTLLSATIQIMHLFKNIHTLWNYFLPDPSKNCPFIWYADTVEISILRSASKSNILLMCSRQWCLIPQTSEYVSIKFNFQFRKKYHGSKSGEQVRLERY